MYEACDNEQYDENRGQNREKCQDEKDPNTIGTRKGTPSTRGVAMSFGFRRRPSTAPVTDNAVAARRLAATELIDRNGNAGTEDLSTSPIPSGRTTPRLAPPKKEANATRINRFGFRQSNGNRLNRVGDVSTPQPIHLDYSKNNNPEKPRAKGGGKATTPVALPQPKRQTSPPVTADTNRAKAVKTSTIAPMPATGRFMLQTTQLPRPQVPVHVMESKLAKTAANNNRKVYNTSRYNRDDGSSKEGSMTEDSGVSSHTSASSTDSNTIRGIEMLDSSPTFGRRNRFRPRNLEMISSGRNSFDVRDLDETTETSVPLPKLPSAFHVPHSSSGMVRERALEYERHLEKDRRKISITSSEGFSDDYGEVEKFRKERTRTEKRPPATPLAYSSQPLANNTRTFLKVSRNSRDLDSTPPSSDEQEWANAGEAMADDFSCSFSSSDESKDNKNSPLPTRATTAAATASAAMTTSSISSALQNLMNTSLTTSVPKTQIRNVLMTLEDPKFAAVVAASNATCLLDEETSPVDSLLCSISDSDEFNARKRSNNKKNDSSSSNSKDVNEKLTLSPESPGTPTNASNSLSLSEGRDFLIDDEIADQPALVFDDNMTTERSLCDMGTVAQQTSDNTLTLVDSTPKVRRKFFLGCDGSPLPLRAKHHLLSRTASVDTLSPCESIASDDLMMDFDHSHSSGFDDSADRLDRKGSGLHSLDGAAIITELETTQGPSVIREWSSLLSTVPQTFKESPTHVARTRLLRSRAGTPNSIPDSPKSLDSHVSIRSRGATHSPLRPPRGGLGSQTFESDESLVRVDKASHGAMLQDIVGIKTMLLKLKRVLHETDEDILTRSETLNPFDTQTSLKNGLFNGLSSDAESVSDSVTSEEESNSRMEMADLRRQIEFLQGQLEDRERTVKVLQMQMTKYVNDSCSSNSAPASTVAETSMCNAATQTDRVRPVSAGPSLLQGLQNGDQNGGPLVSATEKKSRPTSAIEHHHQHHHNQNHHHHHHNHNGNSSSASKVPPPKLWRKPGEPPSPSRFSPASSPSSIPRRANSRTRAPSTPS